MLTCILIIIVIIIILLIAGAVYWSYGGQQNYVYYDGVRYYNGKNGFFSKFRKNKFMNPELVLSNSQIIPPALQPNSYANRAMMARNIDALQGTNTDPEMFRYLDPKDSGDNLKLKDRNCVGFGEDTVCGDFYDYIGGGHNNIMGSNNIMGINNAMGSGNNMGDNVVTSGKDGFKGRRRQNKFSDNIYYNDAEYNNNIANNNTITAKINTAEQEMWMANRNDPTVEIDKKLGISTQPSSPDADYNTYLNSLVIDERTLDNHLKWANEMSPWAGTASRGIDNMDEAMANSGVKWSGLRRPQPIVQTSDALFITEIGAKDFMNNGKFNFLS